MNGSRNFKKEEKIPTSNCWKEEHVIKSQMSDSQYSSQHNDNENRGIKWKVPSNNKSRVSDYLSGSIENFMLE